MSISCNTAKYFAESFIKKEVSDRLYNKILDHIAKCDKCFEYYIATAKKLELDIEVKQGDSRFILNTGSSKDKPIEIKQEFHPSKDVYNCYNTWMDACNVTDLSILMQSKAIRDSVKEEYDVGEDEAETFRNFGIFIMKKICQKIDHLEACLKLDINNKVVKFDKQKKRIRNNA